MKKTICLLFLFILFAPTISFSQKQEKSDLLKTKALAAAKEIMTSSTTCALITLDNEGRPRVRTMDPFAPENDFIVWFGTNKNTRKVEQISNDPRVTLYYLENGDAGYVVIHGKAQLVDDQKEKEKRWKDGWSAFYTNKNKDYLLIKVMPENMEVISYTHGVTADPVTWKPPIVVFDSK